ncbi:hypothetical protein GCM10009785_05070 [Brooklawnia cerclae]|uniref:Phage shock protein PspC (Stress-responsive transcriptional regulator) n=1 Tax=Brooklawnia cerclae TaxID=349934 RepID=A0ABX0SH21_9ACTN|nr:PspC domain-containing protein [Brooklawnia cerclae]NIH55901.1 phage shock protein PspC (stress-responsive transcriptional regulator) [Brooklawnia cerclae]
MSKQLTRSQDHRVIAGVCGGLADYFSIDPLLVRLGAIALGFVSAGLAGGAYAVAWLLLPEEGTGQTGLDQLFRRYDAYRNDRNAGGSPRPNDTFRADE